MQNKLSNKHKKKNVTPTRNTRSKMQHQLFVEHKIHVHQIPKIATLDSKNARVHNVTKGMIISFIHNDNHILR